MDFKNIFKIASLLRDLGLILGVPTAIIVGFKIYKYHIAILKSQIEAFKDSNDILKDLQRKQIETLEC